MPIKSLESYLFERKLANTSSIEILQNATVGIDAEHYLSRIYTFKKEQFLPGIGGVPSSLKEYIKSDLQVFKEFNIKPVFVISGLHIQLQDTIYQTNEFSPQEQHHESSWANLGSKQPYTYNNTIESFRLFTDPLPLGPMVHDLIKYFIELGIDYIISPYDASFQLSYLFQNNFVDTIYGSTDLLLTKIDKFILGMEFQSKDFRFIDKHKVLTELGLTERQFLDLSLMVGCNIQPITFPNFPPLPKPNPVQPYPQLSYFKLGLDIIYQFNQFTGDKNGNLQGYIAGLNDPKLLELYYKGHTAIKYMPVLNREGLIELYNVEMAKLGIEINVDFFLEEESEGSTSEPNSEAASKTASKEPSVLGESSRVVKVPNDIHDVISQRMPPELYFYQSVGLMPVTILEAIAKGRLDIRPPLEAGISESYRRLISLPFYVELLDKQVNLLTQLLARYYQVKKINVKYWYKDAIVEVNNRMMPSISKRMSKFFVYGADSGDVFDLEKFLGKLPQNIDASYADHTIASREDVVSTVLLRTLILFGAIDEKTQELKLLGKILKRVAHEVKNLLVDELQQLVLLLLLISSKSLKLTNPNPEYLSVPATSKLNNEGADLTPRELSYVAMISRVFSLHKFNVSPINYQGPISRNLLNFRSHVLFIAGHVINTIQCLLVDILVQSQHNTLKTTYNGKEDWYNLVDQLPFYKDINNTLLGVVAEIYFEVAAKLAKGGMTSEDAKARAKDHLINGVYQVKSLTFNINVHGMNSISSAQLLEDFSSGTSFWKKFVQMAKIIHEEDSSLLDADYLKSITEADLWMDGLI